MKKITLLFFVIMLGTFTVAAQHVFPTIAGPITVAEGSPVTENVNDAGNTAAVPSGTYYTFVVTADWEAGGGGPWSNEADLTVSTSGGTTLVDPPTAGSGNNGTATSLTFTGNLAGPYDPDTDGTLDIILNQSYNGSDANWSNIVVTLYTCLPPAVDPLTIVDDCANSQFTIEVPITDLGNSTTLTISNDVGVAATTVTAVGTAIAGPFPIGTSVNLTIEHENDSSCDLTGGPFLDSCPPSNDTCATAIPVTCGNTYSGNTGSATIDTVGDCGSVDNDAPNVFFTYTGSGSPENVTISTCDQASFDTSLAVFTGSCGGLVCYANNDDGPDCGGFSSELTFLSDGTTTYYIMVEGYNATSTGIFDLTVTCEAAATPPVNDTCATAEALTLNAVAVSGDNTDATASINNPTCDLFGTIADVWYSFEAPASGNVTVVTAVGSADQANVVVWDDCAFTNELGCSSDNGGESLDITGLTSGSTYYVQVWNDGTSVPSQRAEGTFTIAVSETLSTSSFDLNGFEYFPNPVNDKLSLRAQNNIQNVSIYNILGQEVVRMAPNAISSDVDMTELSNGAYFVKVTINDKTETIKVIKK